MYIIYDFVFFLYAFVYLPYLILTRRGYAGFCMRLGIFPAQTREQLKQYANIWIHAVSVGEVMVLDGVIERLRRDHSACQLVVTVTTKTGYALACERLKNKALVIPSPLDFSWVAGSFVSKINPRIYIAVETEIWPNLFSKLYHHNVPLAVINGRISDNSFGRYKLIRFLLKKILNQSSLWSMQSQQDANRIMELGADPQKVIVSGNIKFDGFLKSGENFPNLTADKEALWWVAGSTHPGEEEIVLDAYGAISKDNPRWRLILAPRHIERVGQIMELVKQRGFKAARLSENKNDNTIIVVDTIGQLRSLYAIASLVFVGKTLTVGGGQNVIEPASYGKAIIIGPYVENFRDIVECFKQANAIVQVADAHEFQIAVRALSADALRREQLGKAALKVIAENQGATERNLERLEILIK